MKFKGELSGGYSPETKTLRIEGKTTAGVRSKVEIPMLSPASFFVFLGSVFRAAERPDKQHTTDVMPMRGLTMGVARNERNTPVAIIFDVSVGGFPVRFGAPIEHLEKSTIQSIEQKLSELTLLMMQVEGANQRN